MMPSGTSVAPPPAQRCRRSATPRLLEAIELGDARTTAQHLQGGPAGPSQTNRGRLSREKPALYRSIPITLSATTRWITKQVINFRATRRAGEIAGRPR